MINAINDSDYVVRGSSTVRVMLLPIVFVTSCMCLCPCPIVLWLLFLLCVFMYVCMSLCSSRPYVCTC